MGWLKKIFSKASKETTKNDDCNNVKKTAEEGFSQQDVENVKDFIIFNAEDGSADDQYELGRMYYYGTGPYGHGTFNQDTEQAIKWLKKSAEQGYVQAMNFLGEYYKEQKNGREMLRYYHLSADQNNPNGLTELAMIYDPVEPRGNVVCVDKNRAHELYYKAALQKDAFAQLMVAINYDQGNGVDIDARKAAEWYWEAAQNGQPYAQYWVGSRCENIGEKDEAISWYKKAAQQGNKSASERLLELL